MLVLFCVQIVQTKNNEVSWKGGKKKCSVDKQKICELGKKVENFIKKKKIDNIYKLIIKEFNLNVNCHTKISRNHNLLQV